MPRGWEAGGRLTNGGRGNTAGCEINVDSLPGDTSLRKRHDLKLTSADGLAWNSEPLPDLGAEHPDLGAEHPDLGVEHPNLPDLGGEHTDLGC